MCIGKHGLRLLIRWHRYPVSRCTLLVNPQGFQGAVSCCARASLLTTQRRLSLCAVFERGKAAGRGAVGERSGTRVAVVYAPCRCGCSGSRPVRAQQGFNAGRELSLAAVVAFDFRQLLVIMTRHDRLLALRSVEQIVCMQRCRASTPSFADWIVTNLAQDRRSTAAPRSSVYS